MYQYTKAAMTMWLLGGGRKDDSESSKHSFSSRGTKKRQSRKGNGKGRGRNKDKTSDETSPTSFDKDCSMHMLAETYSGIEVSLSQDKSRDGDDNDSTATAAMRESVSSSPTESESLAFSENGVISLKEQLMETSKIYRAQFTVSVSNNSNNWSGEKEQQRALGQRISQSTPVPVPVATSTAPATALPSRAVKPEFCARQHRIPLYKKEPDKPVMLFDDFLFLLRSHNVADELECVKEELSLMDEEIAALELDRTDLEKLLPAQNVEGGMKQPPATSAAAAAAAQNNMNATGNLEIHRQLLVPRTGATPKQLLSNFQRTQLQQERGLNITVHFRSAKAQEALMAKCGCKLSVLRKASPKAENSNNNNNNAVVTLIAPHNCRDGGAAATIQHLTLLNSASSSSSSYANADSSSFLLSRDNAKSYHHGRLPDRLFRRMQEMKGAGGDSHGYSEENLLYLSTGPLGCYYAEFRSGECWWGSAAAAATIINNNNNNGDNGNSEFDKICREWDVYRVVFGACTAFGVTSRGGAPGGAARHQRFVKSSSWIVLGRDGRAAWKNLPARLHHKLSSRVASESALVDVALGCGGAYFVRFLDETTDWQLPAKAASVCERLEKEGRTIMSISLNPELSHDFVIRHR